MKTIKKAVVFMAGGLGSRYNGLKQIDGILENGSPLLEYSLYDAIEAGFSNFVFIINSKIPASYVEKLENVLKNKNLEYHFVIQKISDFVDSEEIIAPREKPWGTGHAVLCATPFINSNFLVLNADDYYGKSSFKMAAKLLDEEKITNTSAALVAYHLENTLSENGTVSRGICTISIDGNLKTIEELTSIRKENDEIFNLEENSKRLLQPQDLVSMNFWIFNPCFFTILEEGFKSFINSNPAPKTEYYLPSAVSEFMKNSTVEVLESTEIWKGVTYPEDKMSVKKFLQEKINQKLYPEDLWS